jgi:hypothetical protein
MYNKKSTKTVGQLSDSLYYSIVCLEAEDPYIMPYDLLSDAYKIAKMIVEAEGVTPSEKLLDNIVYYYLERRQQQAANLEDKKC